MPRQPFFYVAGGSLRADAPSYVERRADTVLLDLLRGGELCYVLTPRQMGKSSLKIRAAARLRAEGVPVVVLDLTAIGRNLEPEQWYFGMLESLGEQLGLDAALDREWTAGAALGPMQRFMRVLLAAAQRVAERRPGLVVFVDEIDVVRSLPFSTDEFFAAIREMYNRRAHDPTAALLTFCLLGVAAPSDLIRDRRITPFNVGTRVEIDDFTPAEASVLRSGLCADAGACRASRGATDADVSACAARTLDRVLAWTGGHPYLTQRLCHAVASAKGSCGADAVDPACEAVYLDSRAQESDDNLAYVRDRLLPRDDESSELLSLYGDVLAGRKVIDDARDSLIARLRLSGAVRTTNGRLVVRNRIYARVFDREWIRRSMPGAELERIHAAYRRGVLRTAAVAAAFILVLIIWLITSVSLRRQADRHRAQSDKRRVEIERLASNLGRTAGERAAALRELRRAVAEEKRLRVAADAAGRRAVGAARLAEDRTRVAHQRLVELVAEAGADALKADDTHGALLWFAESLRLNKGSPEREAMDRLRIGTIASHAPGLVKQWFDVTNANFDAAGRRAVTGHQDGSVRVWDTETGAEIGAAALHGLGLGKALISPDGRLAMSVGGRELRVWRVPFGRAPARVVRLRADAVDAAWFPDSARITTYTRAGVIRQWHALSGRQAGPDVAGYPGTGIVKVSADGRSIAASCASGEVVVYDAATGTRRCSTPVIGETADAAFSPGGDLLATATHNFYGAAGGYQGATIWRMGNQSVLHGPLLHQGGARSVAFSPDGRRLVSTGADRRAQVWDVETGAPTGPPIDLGSPGQQASFDGTGRVLVTAAQSTGARLWDTATGEPVSPWIAAGSGAVRASLGPDGRRLLTVDSLRHAALWRLVSPAQRELHSQATTACLSPDGRSSVVCGRPGASRLWPVGGAGGRPAPLAGAGSIADAAFSPDSRLVGAGCYDGDASIWSAATGLLLFHVPHMGEVSQVLFSRDGRSFVTTTAVRVSIWAVRTGRLRKAFGAHGSPIIGAAIGPDSRTLVTADDSGLIEFLDVDTGRVLRAARRSRDIAAIEFSPDGSRVLTAGADGCVLVWAARTGQPTGLVLRHPYSVRHACWRPDGRVIAAAIGEQDGTGPRSAHLWNAATGAPLTPPLVHRGAVRHVGFSPDGKLVVTSSADRTVRVWDAATGLPITQPLRMPGQVYFAQIARGNRSVLAASNDGAVRLWDLVSATGSPEYLMAQAEALSGRRIDTARGVVSLDSAGQKAALAAMRRSAPARAGR